ncbi:hypothetical protein L7F22_053594 [Adiantum nelumboides]|nr:hypothetical protein [Adiantum nelumboides]
MEMEMEMGEAQAQLVDSCTASNMQAAMAKYKGVRQRSWGTWVSEIRVPASVGGAQSRARIWLGSYRSAPAAALARDVALLLLHGHTRAAAHHLNFPAHFYPSFPPEHKSSSLPPSSIQSIAMAHGNALDRQISTLSPITPSSIDGSLA